MPTTPLGGYAEFAEWSSGPCAWGPEGTWRASFAGGVVDDLIDGILSFPAELRDRLPAKAEAMPVAIGCVPWFGSVRVAEALCGLGGATLIVVDKGQRRVAARVRGLLESADAGFRQNLLPGLDEMGPLDNLGKAPAIHPSGPMPGDRLIGPLRVAGWKEARQRRPLLHTKLLVLGAWWHWDSGEGEMDTLTPMKVWFGSANWTDASSEHLEFGAWCGDDALLSSSLRFCEDLVRFSEPFDAGTAGPEPELVAGEWDDAAFYEAHLAQQETAPDTDNES